VAHARTVSIDPKALFHPRNTLLRWEAQYSVSFPVMQRTQLYSCDPQLFMVPEKASAGRKKTKRHKGAAEQRANKRR
jgi:hypothetical protein